MLKFQHNLAFQSFFQGFFYLLVFRIKAYFTALKYGTSLYLAIKYESADCKAFI